MDTLVLTRKKQNTRRSLQESIYKIYNAGIFVFAGFIVGFDSEKGDTADGIIECIEDTAIPVCIVGLLYALPATQLGRRLLREGRLFSGYDGPSPQDEVISARPVSTSQQNGRAVTCLRITWQCLRRFMIRPPISAASDVSAGYSGAESAGSRHQGSMRCGTSAPSFGWYGACLMRVLEQPDNSGRPCSTAPSITLVPCPFW